MKLEVKIDCCLCRNEHTTSVELPAGWTHKNDGIDDGAAFCPDHAAVAPFADSQCPGCVGGWMDCGLWTSFAYSGRRDLTEADFATMRTGVCPRRVNGTLSFSRSEGMKPIDLSNRAPAESGIALEVAIKAYMARYPV